MKYIYKIYTEYNSVCPLVGIGTLTSFLSPASVLLPPVPKGGGHTRLRMRGWGSPNSYDFRKSLSSDYSVHIKRQATRHDCLPSLLCDGDKLSEIVR